MSAKVFQELRLRSQLDPVVRRKLAANPLQFLEQFDLSFDEKRQIIIPQFTWVLERELAAMPFPATEDAYVILWQLGIRAILNLTGYVDDAPGLSDFTVYHIPIANMKPPTLQQMHQATSMIQASLKSGQPVAVHCEAGLGRTGTIIAAYLTRSGMSAQEAIETIRRLRPGSIETEEQEASIYEYEHHLPRLLSVDAA
ncbi:MAG TPA: dual specificity protein phosphatase family protein [Ktedonobacteraceae bacterium]|nr:dual specificity protein phosphatase family protein [Ktedonobacteraceae bacterium]